MRGIKCFALLLTVFVLNGCNSTIKTNQKAIETQTPEKFSIKLSAKNYPRVNGSTPTTDISKVVYEAITGEKFYEANKKINHEGTSASYEALLDGRCDLIISQQASPEILKQLKKVAIIKPVAKDALVFIATNKNKVNSLTTKQLNSIFTGKFENWEQVGGENLPIITIQRNEAGGSQILIEKYVMEGKAMVRVPDYLKPENMSDMSTAVGKYDKLGHTIGYSTYFYVRHFDVRDYIKMLGVNGVEPSSKSISDGSYPIVSKIYVAIRKDVPNNSSAKKLFNWLLSNEGQNVVGKSGYPAYYTDLK